MGNIFERCFEGLKGIKERIAKAPQPITLIELNKAKTESPKLYKALSGLDDDSRDNLSALNDVVTPFGLSIHNADSPIEDRETGKVIYHYDTVIQPRTNMSKEQVVDAVSKIRDVLSDEDALRSHLQSTTWEVWPNQYRANGLLLNDSPISESRWATFIRPELTQAVDELYTRLANDSAKQNST